MIGAYTRGTMYSGITSNRLSFLLLGNKSGYLSLLGYEAKSLKFREKISFLLTYLKKIFLYLQLKRH